MSLYKPSAHDFIFPDRSSFGGGDRTAIITPPAKETEIENPIHQLAEAAGVLTEWVDVWGEPQQVSDDHLIAALEALTGRDLGREERIRGAVLDLTNERPLVEPVLVAWDGHLDPVETAHPVSSASLITETGDEVPLVIEENRLLIEGPLPLGYHELHVSRAEHPTTVISAPIRAHEAPRYALGVNAPVYALRSAETDSGVGTYSHLEQLADLGLVTGAAVIGTLPVVATFADQPSPYAPASRRAWNELFVDLTRAPGWDGELPIHTGDPLWVDYEEAATRVRSALVEYTAAVAGMPQIMSQIEAFGSDNPEMVRYAEFRATCDRYGRNWRAWPRGAAGYPDRIQYHLTGQWLATEQLADLGGLLADRGQYLYLDLPIGCHPDGYDIWDKPDLYAPASVGAPPDSLFLGGQEWGLPAMIPAQARRTGHLAFRKAVRHQLSVAGLLRIDHIMGLHRAWWVPRGLKATDGSYILQPTEEMFAIICLESHRAGAAVIGENLGTVPDEISEALEAHGLLGMKVAQDGLKDPGSDELIALSTHDSPPFAAWWKGIDIDDGEDLGVYTDGRGDTARHDRLDTIEYIQGLLSTDGLEETRDAILEWMAQSDAAIAVANLDDLWAEDRRQNVPGTDTERPNWRARHRVPLEEVAQNRRILAQLERLSELRKETHDGSPESISATD